jgi:thiamine-phosphate pyrophosphorylase
MLLPRVYPIIDGGLIVKNGLTPAAAAEALLEAGARILQLRWKEAFGREIFSEAERIALMCRSANATFILNDRPDVAALIEGGAHLGQDDLPPRDARAIIGSALPLGYSTHNEDQLRAADDEPVDYLALGPIFGTTSKARPDPVVGLDNLERLRPLTTKPLVAIGGITRETAPAVWRAGADSVAVIADLYPEGGGKASVRQRAEEWMRIAARE